MKKYVFLLKKATRSEVEIEAENKDIAFKKLVKLVTEDEEKIMEENDVDKQILRIKLKAIIEENADGNLQKNEYKSDEDLLKIVEELDEDEDNFFRRI